MPVCSFFAIEHCPCIEVALMKYFPVLSLNIDLPFGMTGGYPAGWTHGIYMLIRTLHLLARL
jgi:hypothetical protein